MTVWVSPKLAMQSLPLAILTGMSGKTGHEQMPRQHRHISLGKQIGDLHCTRQALNGRRVKSSRFGGLLQSRGLCALPTRFGAQLGEVMTSPFLISRSGGSVENRDECGR
ncbi:hypothetical protein PGTUg99_025219 [Puccinia graminis f. sp. tritici]|uniref:Uncharacterized protein n=1 Tax=Puccinia graminis f. sp. tritici TaxID=56615 RepID=A0A5B0RDP5_PUCGR|nr:hypothetical protein PGTUg99_025219 [Puccinia graminis f. sp. tritici]